MKLKVFVVSTTPRGILWTPPHFLLHFCLEVLPYLLLSCEGGIFWAWNEEAAPKGTLIQRGYNSDNNLGQFKWHVGVGLNK